MYSAVRIIGDRDDGSRVPIGTGFCVYIPSEVHPGVRYGYILTAHHVIAGREKNIEVEIPDQFKNGFFYPRMQFNGWHQPIAELDLALVPIRPAPLYNIQSLEYGHHIVPDLPLLLGNHFYYVGILDPLDRPMVRSGTLGALDQAGIPHDGPYNYIAHLADCRSYGGFSGSPCFVELPIVNLEPYTLPPTLEIPSTELPDKMGSMAYLHLLCGMFTQHIDSYNVDRLVSRAGVGVILRSNEIAEALMTEDMQAERRLWDTEKRIDDEKDRPRSVSATADEFDSFQDLVKKVVQVPKSEIDKKRKK